MRQPPEGFPMGVAVGPLGMHSETALHQKSKELEGCTQAQRSNKIGL